MGVPGWVDLPNAEGHRAFLALLKLALREVAPPGPGISVMVRFFDDGFPHVDSSHRLFVLGSEDSAEMLAAIEAGASGYLPLSRPTDEIAEAIGQVATGRAVIPDEMLGSLLRRVVQERRAVTASAMTAGLTPREREVLELAARGQGKSEIAGALGISPATARTHLANIMAKLDVHSRAELVAMAAASGFDTSPEEKSRERD